MASRGVETPLEKADGGAGEEDDLKTCASSFSDVDVAPPTSRHPRVAAMDPSRPPVMDRGLSFKGAALMRLLEQRGARFAHDNRDICFCIQRSKNKNIVVYQAATGTTSSMGLSCYWLKIDPEYVAPPLSRLKTA